MSVGIFRSFLLILYKMLLGELLHKDLLGRKDWENRAVPTGQRN